MIKKAAWASWIGSALEYYDFFIYGIASALFLGPLFFPNSNSGWVSFAAIASVGVGYVSRPLGAFFFGYVGDVYGRRLVLSITLVLMGISTFIIGVLPTYQEIGVTASVLLVCLRLLQGFAVGGEHASANALVLELSGNKLRGLYTSLSLSGTQIGLILASVVFLLLSNSLPETFLRTWGWRIPFLLSAVLVAIGCWIRFSMPESPEFLSERGTKEAGLTPLKLLATQYKRSLFTVLMASQVSVVSSIVAVFSLSWAVNVMDMPKSTMLATQATSAALCVFTIPAWAYLSDRIGRKPVFLFGALMSAVLVWPYLWAIEQANVPLVFVFNILLTGIAYSAANGVWPSLYGEMFSTKVRLSGVAIGSQCGFTLAAQASAIAAYLTLQFPANWTPVAWLVSISCAISAGSVFFVDETSRTDLNDLGHKFP